MQGDFDCQHSWYGVSGRQFDPIVLPPGAQDVSAETLATNVFSRAGPYRVKAHMELADGKVLESAAVAFQVRQPTEADIAAQALVDDIPMAWALAARPMVRPDAKTVARLRVLVDHYPDAALADHARYALGREYPSSPKAPPQPNYSPAYVYWQAVSDRVPRLRLRSAIYRAFVVGANQVKVPAADMEGLLKELDANPADTALLAQLLEWRKVLPRMREHIVNRLAIARGEVAAFLRKYKDDPRGRGLMSLRREAKPALKALIAAMKDEYHNVRVVAAGALSYVGPDARDAIPVLTEALKDPHVRQSAAMALKAIQGKE